MFMPCKNIPNYCYYRKRKRRSISLRTVTQSQSGPQIQRLQTTPQSSSSRPGSPLYQVGHIRSHDSASSESNITMMNMYILDVCNTTLELFHLLKTAQKAYCYTPANFFFLRGAYLNHPVQPSRCLSVHPSVQMSCYYLKSLKV